MSQEKVREILSHVDMTKIDLSSFKLSENKFDELAVLYRNRVILSCVSMIACKSEEDRELVDQAFKIIKKVAANPNMYNYSTIYANERKIVDAAIDDITTHRDRNINDVKLKAIEKRMKDAYKSMRKTIEMALENGNSFEYEFDEATVERCLRTAQAAIEDGRQKAAAEKDMSEEKSAVESDQTMSEVQCEAAASDTTTIPQNVQVASNGLESTDGSEKEVEKPKKVSIWKRIFGKKAAV